MRLIIIFMTVLLSSLQPALCADNTGFESFVKSREVVATLYFQANSEDLVKGERERVLAAISQLRELQEDGRMIRVEGFSSPEGDVEENFRLSFFRARVVADLLEAKGMPEEVTLTGYGDLRAKDNGLVEERRVEIASYIKPKPMKSIKIAKKKRSIAIPNSPDVTQSTVPEHQVIDSYSVEQAIKRKIEAKNKSLAEQNNMIEDDVFPGLSQSPRIYSKDELERGYTLWRNSVNPRSAPKLTKVQNTSDDLRRGYSQAVRATDNDIQRGYSQSEKAAKDLQRGYSQSEKAAKDLQRGYSQSEKAAKDLQRGYSQSEKAAKDLQRGYSQSEKAAKDLQRGYSQSEKAAKDLQRGYSQSEKAAKDLQRGYSQSEKAAKDLQRGYSQSEKAAKDLQRGYSQWIKTLDPELSPGVTWAESDMPPVIDALMIEQAIMEKIGSDPLTPSGTITQLDSGY